MYPGLLFICLQSNLTIKCKEKVVHRIIFNNFLLTFLDIISSPDYKAYIRKRQESEHYKNGH